MCDQLCNRFKNSFCALLVLTFSILSYEFTFASTVEGEKCNVDPHPSWTLQEKWVWQKICLGEVADFNEAAQYGGRLDPLLDKNWPKNRILSQTFIETILLHKPYSEVLPHQGINIGGAWFDKPIDLSDATFEHPLRLYFSRFDKDVNLNYLKTSKPISFHGSKFKGVLFMFGAKIDSNLLMKFVHFDHELILRSAEVGKELVMGGSKFRGQVNMESLKVGSNCLMEGAEFDREVTLRSAKIDGQLVMGGGSKFNRQVNLDKLQVDSSLFLSRGAEFRGEVILRSAKVGGQLVMGEGSKYKGPLNMEGLKVDSSLYMDKAEFNGIINIIGAKVGPELDMSGSKFTNKVNIDKVDVYGSLYMREGADFEGEVILNSVQVGSQLTTSGSKFKDKVSIDGLKVDDLFMRNGIFLKDVDIIYTHVNRNLDISNSILNVLDLTGTTIGGELRLGSKFHPPVKWGKGSKLVLRNTNVVALQDIENAWPEELELDGFTYSSLGGLYGEETYSMATRKISWLKQWLDKQKYYSPQPYEQLSKVLTEAGQGEKARDVLYLSKDREKITSKGPNYYWLTLLKYAIGYGYRLYYIFVWLFGMSIIGMIVLTRSKKGPGRYVKQREISGSVTKRILKGICFLERIGVNFLYSLDMLIPVIKFDEWSKVELDGFSKCYFYIHKRIGYILSFVIVAWLTGIIHR